MFLQDTGIHLQYYTCHENLKTYTMINMQKGSFRTLLLEELGSSGTEWEPGEKVTGILAGHCHLKGHLFKMRCDNKEETALQQ
jgi:hypothetical protein